MQYRICAYRQHPKICQNFFAESALEPVHTLTLSLSHTHTHTTKPRHRLLRQTCINTCLGKHSVQRCFGLQKLAGVRYTPIHYDETHFRKFYQLFDSHLLPPPTYLTTCFLSPAPAGPLYPTKTMFRSRCLRSSHLRVLDGDFSN